jgi:hypothetical protein
MNIYSPGSLTDANMSHYQAKGRTLTSQARDAEEKCVVRRPGRWLLVFLLVAPAVMRAQGTRADYEQAERFLPWNIEREVSIARVRPLHIFITAVGIIA